ncbi:MAG: CoA-binding protein, partial [Dehalococcoidia bacterium]
MPTLKESVDDFLAQKRIAVVGVSRSGREAANMVYRKLRGAGYQVFAVNPNADEVEGDTCFPNLTSIPGSVEAVVIATAPEVTESVVRDCAEQGISRVW